MSTQAINLLVFVSFFSKFNHSVSEGAIALFLSDFILSESLFLFFETVSTLLDLPILLSIEFKNRALKDLGDFIHFSLNCSTARLNLISLYFCILLMKIRSYRIFF